MAQDEGRFGRISSPKKTWAPAGIRPKSPRQVVREFLYAYSAVCPSKGKITSLILPYANTEMMNIFLNHVSSEFKEHFIHMLVDRAGWHVSKKLKVPENIKLIPQPSHSPELNPTEHIWDEIREKHFQNRAFKSLDHVENTLCYALNDLDKHPDKIKSMTNFPYLNITAQNAT